MKRFTTKRESKKGPKQSRNDAGKTNLNVRGAKLMKQVTYGNLKCLGGITAVLLIIITIFSLKLLVSSISIRSHLGRFINMISKGDGDILPSLQAVPVFFFLLIDIILVVVVYQIFDKEERPKTNWILFLFLMISLALIFLVLILLIVIIQHIYGAHEALHNGILEAMKDYSSNSAYKVQMDRLQIEFQCCGSKKYDEWYNITWYDTGLIKKGASDNSQGNTPFSCCSMSSIFPCIHHNIENTGKAYLYTPELNLSISTHGCYTRLREKKQEIGWGIIGNLFLYIMLQAALIVCLRFLQTAHFERSKFEGHSRLYTIWLIGCYTERDKEEIPPAPSVPPESPAPPVPPFETME